MVDTVHIKIYMKKFYKRVGFNMIRIKNLKQGLSKSQVKMLRMVANIVWCGAINKGQKEYAAELKQRGIEFNDLVEYMEDKHRLLVFGTVDYLEITGKNNTYEEVEKYCNGIA